MSVSPEITQENLLVMPRPIRRFVALVDRINYGVGRFAVYLIFVMMAILLWSSVSKTFFQPSLWTLEMAQFTMVAYYVLGGPYSMQDSGDAHVRMDLFYGGWSPKQKALMDLITVACLLFFLGVLLWGGIESTAYSLSYYGDNPVGFFWDMLVRFLTGGPQGVSDMLGTLERSNTAWRPYMWPVKAIMCIGFLLMILQTLSEFFKDIANIRGAKL